MTERPIRLQKPDLRQDLRRFHPADIATGLGVAGLMLPEAVAYAGIAGLPAGRALMTRILSPRSV